MEADKASSIWSRQAKTEDGGVDLEQAVLNRRRSRGTEVWRHQQGEGSSLGKAAARACCRGAAGRDERNTFFIQWQRWVNMYEL
jgi:hypothetical protein